MTRTAVLLLLSLGLATGCTKSQAELERGDRERLEAVVAEDARVSAMMAEVDKAARRGDFGAAIGILGSGVGPGLADEQRALDGAAPTTAWGRKQRDELAGLVADRQAAVAPYREAMQSRSPEAQLAVIENEAKIERRALAVVAALRPGR